MQRGILEPLCYQRYSPTPLQEALSMEVPSLQHTLQQISEAAVFLHSESVVSDCPIVYFLPEMEELASRCRLKNPSKFLKGLYPHIKWTRPGFKHLRALCKDIRATRRHMAKSYTTSFFLKLEHFVLRLL